jgi:hypothetical protein
MSRVCPGTGTPNIQHRTSNIENPGKAPQSHTLVNAEMLKAEMLKAEKTHKCDIKATPKPVDRQLIGTPKPP